MTPAAIGPVFGRGSLRIPTGEHVEIIREAAEPGKRRRYRKRFLEGRAGDLRPWTARERRILEQLGEADSAVARLAPVPARGNSSLHTFDAGPTVDQWSRQVRLRRNGLVLESIFEDCACWWALARSCLGALDKLHPLGFVHLDLKADNVCIPWRQTDAGDVPLPGRPLALHFEALTLIDVAWSLLPGVSLPGPLPLDRQPDYAYQSPRLMEALEQGRRGNPDPTQALDWRCDLFSLAAMLWQYLPELGSSASGWTPNRHHQATAFVRLLVDADTGPLPAQRPHPELIVVANLRLREPELAAALRAGFTFDCELPTTSGVQTPPTFFFRPAGAPTVGSALAPAPPGMRAAAGEVHSRDQALAAAPVSELPVHPSSSRHELVDQPTVDLLLADLEPSEPASVDLHLPDLRSIPPGIDLRSPMAQSEEPDWVDLHLPDLVAPPAVPTAVEPLPCHSAQGRREPIWVGAESESLLAEIPPLHVAPRGRRGLHRLRHQSTPILAPIAVAVAVVVAAAWWALESGRLDLPWGRAFATVLAGGAAATAPQPTPEVLPPAPLAQVPASAPSSAAAVLQDVAPRSPEKLEIFLPSPPRRAPPISVPPATVSREPGIAGDFDGIARQLMQGPMVRRAAGAERQLAPVLAAAGDASDGRSARDVRAAARSARHAVASAPLPVMVASPQARRLNEAARIAYWQRDNVPEAVTLQTRAFGANPLDTEVVGNLAFLRLREDPPHPEAARTLALHALTLKDDRFPTGRIEDWTTLAIANALTGRELDARNAWYVTMAISGDLERHCKAAVRAQAIYGDKLRSSVQSMLKRARASPGYARCGAASERTAIQPAQPRELAASSQDARRGG